MLCYLLAWYAYCKPSNTTCGQHSKGRNCFARARVMQSKKQFKAKNKNTFVCKARTSARLLLTSLLLAIGTTQFLRSFNKTRQSSWRYAQARCYTCSLCYATTFLRGTLIVSQATRSRAKVTLPPVLKRLRDAKQLKPLLAPRDRDRAKGHGHVVAKHSAQTCVFF